MHFAEPLASLGDVKMLLPGVGDFGLQCTKITWLRLRQDGSGPLGKCQVPDPPLNPDPPIHVTTKLPMFAHASFFRVTTSSISCQAENQKIEYSLNVG